MKVIISLLALFALDFSARIALTFDDGPCSNGDSLISAITQAGVPATHFLIGQNVGGHENQIKSAVSAGHEIGCHGYNSNPPASEVTQTQQQIAAAGGGTCKIFRAPNLDYGSIVQTCAQLGLALIGTDVIGQDWNSISTSQVVSNIVNAAHDGGIALLHWPNTAPETVAAVPQIVSQLKSKGYEFLTVSGLCGSKVQAGQRIDRC
uniref:Predicted xylanase/chitin deacetylase n=1 Tax=Reticulitermes speratus TaxID=60591 RepID=Q2WFX5_9NEOP|nr:predicted xylanase/chitin deacetylase [Reticulitermes speratus]